ncbi:hypothetical protein FGO68_gene10586 [Halteria grandinella]|uniref:Thioredoxin domain-containing protein n=1 Tax=Halteria grandinella TaxID=5974 RepID=A0A8J8NLQ8_HALGN|nr:hypothetical protein FGO68_gene10586 [Halteria grandinella]
MKSKLILLLALLATQAIAQLPQNWWLQNKALPVESGWGYQNLLDGDLKDKVIIIDFYMQYCKWCYYVVEDFNRLKSDVERWYGPDKVAFIKIDGQLVSDVASRYQVMYFPHFTAIKAGTNGQEHSHFRNAVRNYETLKEWVVEVMGDTPIVDSGYMEQREGEEVRKVQEELQSVLSDLRVRGSDTQDVAFIDVMKSVSEQGIKDQRKLEGLLKQIELYKLSNQDESTHDESSQGMSGMTAFLGGILMGAIASVGFVIYINIQQPKKKQEEKHGPSDAKRKKSKKQSDEEKVA